MITTETRPATLALPRSFTAAAILVGAIPFAIHAWVTLQGYFGHDDFAILYRAAGHGPFDAGYLFQDYNGHLAPGMFLLAWIVTALAPLSHVMAVLPLLMIQAGALVLAWRLLVRCFGRRWVLLVPFAVYAFSPLILFSTIWWAYGVQLLPLLLGMFGALNSHVQYLQTGNRRYISHTVLWTLAAMAFYEKPVLFIGLLLGVTVLLAPDGQRVAALREHWRVWVAQGTLTVCYIGVYLTATASQVQDSRLSDGAVVELIRRTVVDTFIPSLFGGLWTESSFGGAISTPPLAPRLVIVALAVAVVAAGIVVGRSRATLAWLLLGGYLAIDIALVVTTRLHQVGPLVGNDPRYIADAVPVAVLCGAFAFLKPGGEGGPRRPVVLGLVILLGTSATISLLQLAPGLQFAKSRQYVAAARASLAGMHENSFYDTRVPNEIMHEWFVDGKASRVIGLLPDAPEFDQPAETMYLLDANGTPKQITGVADPVIGRPGPYEKCGYTVGSETTAIPLSGHVQGRRLLRMEYYTSGSGLVTFRFGKVTRDIYFKDGLHVLYIVVDGPFDRIDLNRATPVDPMCVVDVRIGVPIT